MLNQEPLLKTASPLPSSYFTCRSLTKLSLYTEDHKTTATPMWRAILIFPKGEWLIKPSTQQHFSNDESGSRGVTGLFLCVSGWLPLFFNKTRSQGDIAFILSRSNTDSETGLMNIRRCSKGDEQPQSMEACGCKVFWPKYGFDKTLHALLVQNRAKLFQTVFRFFS